MRSQPVTRLSPTSIANRLRRVFDEEAVDAAARSTGFMRRKREVTPLALIVACLSSLATGGTRWLADIQRTLNASLGTAVQYKPFHNQLSKEAFPEFVRELFVQALGQLVLPVLESIPSDCLARFDDIVIQDGSSLALKDTLADVWPGRFNKISPAAIELHVTMSVSSEQCYFGGSGAGQGGGTPVLADVGRATQSVVFGGPRLRESQHDALDR